MVIALTCMKKSICVFILSVSIFAADAQKRNNVWAFGDSLGMNFNTDPITPFKSRSTIISTPYYQTSICDKNGVLLFYTDGLKIWNANNVLLPKHGNWWPWDGNVMPLIVPYPQNDSLYYLFGIGDDGNNPFRLQYTTIRAPESWYTGDVIFPRPSDPYSYFRKLSGGTSLVLAGTTHCNEKDVWVVTHVPGAFHSHLVTAQGVDSAAVITPVPFSILPGRKLGTKNSNIKFSANGERMIVPLMDENKIAVFDFNNQTGKFSNPLLIAIPEGQDLEDIEISPDAGKLYAASFNIIDPETQAELHYIYQMDLNAGTAAQIEATRYQINGFGDRVVCFRTCFVLKRTMQLGPDGRIYVSMRTEDKLKIEKALSVIEEPNNKRGEVRYRTNAVNLKRMPRSIAYNYIRSASFTLHEKGIKVQKSTCSDRPVKFALLFNEVDSVHWEFGDPASGDGNFSTSLEAEHQYPVPGTYTAKAVIYKKCIADTSFSSFTISSDPSVHVPAAIRDTTMCVGDVLRLNASVPTGKSYTWENGLIYPERTIDQPGHYAIALSNGCSYDRKDFDVLYEECPCSVFVPGAFTPDRNGLNDLFKPLSKCFAKNYSFRIFDRYGQVIFESDRVNEGWDGTRSDREMPSGVYVWILQYQNPNTKEIVRRNGTVALIR
jgi:gliding motility-associated-like protein